MTTYIDADEAAHLLGVAKPSLYAYVSRGMLSRRSASDGRTSLYDRDEVERMAARNRRRPAAGEPTIDIRIRSGITSIADDGVRYRGRDAALLAEEHTFEEVAELLWSGSLPDRPTVWPVRRRDLRRARAVVAAADHVDPTTVLALATTGIEGGSAPDVARRLLAVAPSLLGGPSTGRTAERLARAWHRSPAPELVAAIDRALVLLADHELATSTIGVRVAASVRSSPAHALAAGLHVVAGPLHGSAAAGVAELLADIAEQGAGTVIAARRATGSVPGFGHSVYRTADPRLAPLLAAVRVVPADRERHAAVDDLLTEGGRLLGAIPNVDLGLGALLFVGELPPQAPLFPIARIAGWAAHDAEERDERPVRYRGITRPR